MFLSNNIGRMERPPRAPSFKEAFRFWLKLGFISFGGPTGQIAIMHDELVERRKWISDARFLHALNFCMLLPGPEATQLATYIGWLLHRTWGGIVAGVLFVLPSATILWALSFIYVTWGNVPWLVAVFYGLKPAVLAIVAAAAIRIGRRALKTPVMWVLAGVAFVAIYFFAIPFPAIVLSAAIIGFIGGTGRFGSLFASGHGEHGETKPAAAVLGDDVQSPAHARPSLARSLKVLALSVVLWFGPVVAVALWLGRDHTLVHEGIFFSKAAMVTFGGAYAVLPYVSQQAVEHYEWLSAAQMLDGLGLAETTPGPLIMVLQFVGFLGAWNHPGGLSPLVAGTLGALLTTWTTFVPCFLWIFLGAPHIEQMRGNVKLSTALAAVTAAIVGVILNLAVWFAHHVLFPGPGRIDWFALAVALVAFGGMLRWKWGAVPVVLGSALVGLLFRLL